MKQRIVVLGILVAMCSAWSGATPGGEPRISPSHGAPVDNIVATVNGEAILLPEFQKKVNPILEQFKKNSPGAEQDANRILQLKQTVLSQMINERLLLQESKKRQFNVTAAEIDDALKQVRARFTNEGEFKQQLDQSGMTIDTYRQTVSDQLLTSKLLDKEVKAKTTVASQSDVKELYDTVYAMIYEKPLPAGRTLGELERLKSLAGAVAKRFGERVRAQHIFIRVDPKGSKADQESALKKIKDIQQRLKNGSAFSELATQLSEDEGTKTRGGELGFFAHGDMAPAFEKAAFSLPIGEVSEPIPTDFGYHLIRVEEKSAASQPSLAPIKDDLKNYVMQQRASQRYDEFLRELAGKAQIKIIDQSVLSN